MATTLLVYSWSSDVLDGALARWDRSSIPTWIGKHDLYFDMAVAFGLLVFMTARNTINLSASIIYILIWILIFSRFGLLSALGRLFQAPIYAWFILTTFQYVPLLGGFLFVLLLLIIVVIWPRFPSDTVSKFLSGFSDRKPSQSS